MDLNHLHLLVRDVASSQRFYGLYFGFTKRTREGNVIFLRNTESFDLALSTDREPQSLPDWFHFGFRAASSKAVREMFSRMAAGSVPIVKPLYEDEKLTSFQCADPDGYKIEVYWEK